MSGMRTATPILVMPEPYTSRLKGMLEFHDLDCAEQSLLRIDAIYREYYGAADRLGVAMVRALVKKGKLRARSLAANPRVNPQKRQEKQEIASWFQVWLETPDLFADWLGAAKILSGIPPTLPRPDRVKFLPTGRNGPILLLTAALPMC